MSLKHRIIICCGLLASAVVYQGCLDGTSDQAPTTVPKRELPATSQPTSLGDSIGQATMRADGAIVLQLRAQDAQHGGDAVLIYKSTDRDYQMVLRHIGGLQRGQTKPVPPWP